MNESQHVPRQELEDFQFFWSQSMINPSTMESRPAGGSDHVDEFGVSGVDYSKQLIPWCKGNSVSVDQTTLQLYRSLISQLFENYLSRISVVDSSLRAKEIDSRAGLTFANIEKQYGKAQTPGNRRFMVGEFVNSWTQTENLFFNLLVDNHVSLYSSANTLNLEQDRIIDDIKNRVHINMGPQKWMSHGICNQLKKTSKSGGHLRLNGANGWDTYIRDHYGAPSGIEGIIPGSLRTDLPRILERTMPLPLHIALSETYARAHGHGTGNEWGKNQSKIRRQIADAAIEGEGDRISLDDYYIIFARNSAPHMADSFFHRSVSDASAARYELVEVPNSAPKRWDVLLEPEFVRWRELRRERERLL